MSRAEAVATAHAPTEKIVRSFPNATAVFLPGNHFVAAGNPEAFNAAARGFLKEPQGIPAKFLKNRNLCEKSR